MNAEQIKGMWEAAEADYDVALHEWREMQEKYREEGGVSKEEVDKAMHKFLRAVGYATAMRDVYRLVPDEYPVVTLPDVQPESVESVTPYGDYCGYCYHHHADCICDYCKLQGHKWSVDYVVDYQIFHSCEVCGLEEAIGVMGVSGHPGDPGEQVSDWRQQIVEEAVKEDGQNGR